MRNIKKLIALLLTVVMLVGLMPTTVFAGKHDNQVRVIVENTTWSKDDGAPWDGTLVDTWVDIDGDSTMMTAVVAALGTVDATQTGAEYGYISEINGIKATDAGFMSGWMGTLNDWFTNYGFGDFTVSDGTLEAGDEIRIMHTMDYGEDIGGSWSNNDKTVKAISFSTGRLNTIFDKDMHFYILTVPADTTGVIVTPTATNKNFQVRTSVNGTEYKRTAMVPVEDGTVITVKCGDPSWPTMNEAGNVPAETYTITVAMESSGEKDYSKLDSLIIHTGWSPSDSNVLLKNASDSYTSGLTFDADTLTYTLATQTDSVKQLRFRALAAEEGAKVTIHYYNEGSKDITWTSGNSKWVNCLTDGRNTFTIVVTPPEGSDKLATTYTFTVDCIPTLTGLSAATDSTQLYLDKAFDSMMTGYTLTVPDSATSVTLVATPKFDAYSVTYNGSTSNIVNISSTNKIDVVVTAGTETSAVSNTYTITLNKVSQLDFKVNAIPSDAIVKVYDQNGANVTANNDGSYSGMFGTYDYTYTVTKYGYVAATGTVPAAGGQIDVTLTEAADDGLADVSAYWKNFRNSDANMAITDIELPIDTENINLKWNAKLGSGWLASPSVQIIVDNALVVMSGETIYKLDLKTGETLATGTMVSSPSYGYTPPIYAEGMIFCPLGGGTVQAFNAETLESLWVYTDPLGGQALSPITYSDGYIYTGFWYGETRYTNFVCISVTDEDVTDTKEAKTATWRHTQKGGFYWAGSVIIGDAVIVGTDDGTSGYEGTAKLYSFNKYTGAVISKLDITGDQRSSIAYDSARGRIYFTTKCGYLYSASVDPATGVISDLKGVNHNAQTTSTPLVYKDKVYFGTGSGISSTGSSGNFVVANADTLKMLYAVGLKGYPQCSMLMTTAYEAESGYIYLYSTYNAMPGGISMIKVDPDAATADGAELIELYDAAGFQQYCITSLICGPDGTIYYKNDSGNVLAVGVPQAVGVTKLINAIGTVTLSSGDAITIARNAYDSLPDDEKKNVANYDVLTAAETAFSNLQINNVKVLINGIGIVKLSSEADIVQARNAYDALTSAQKEKVTNYSTLTAAEAGLAELKKQTLDVAGMINAIGTVNISSEAAIKAARTAYDALTAEQKAFVTNLSTLTGAEARLKALKGEVKNVNELINAIEKVTVNSESAIKSARKAYNALNSEQKVLVANYSTLVAAQKTFDELNNQGEPTGDTKKITDTGNNENDNKEDGQEFAMTDDKQVQDAADTADEQTKAVIEMVDALGPAPSEKDVIAAYKAYQALNDDQKSLVTKYAKLEETAQVLGETNHTDKNSGILLDDAEWYVKVVVESVEVSDSDKTVLKEKLGENTLIILWDISLVDTLMDEKYTPDKAVTIKIPLTQIEGYVDYDGIAIVHYTESGQPEYLEGKIEGDYLVFNATDFSYYGVVGYIGASPFELDAEQSLWWLWVIIGCIGAMVLATVPVLLMKKKKEGADENIA